MTELFWGIDLGGTKIEGVALHPKDPLKPRCRMRCDTGAESGYENVIRNIQKLIQKMEAEVGPCPSRIGFGTPGVLDPILKTMKNCNTQCLNGRSLKADLVEALNKEIRMANDANCFALAEALLGAGKGAKSVFGVILGTGVGGGVIINGEVLDGAQGIAGEWGHNVLEPDGEPCYCGKRGCVEQVFSGPALEKFYAKRSGKTRRLPEIAQSVDIDEDAALTIRRLEEMFGAAISVVINILDPEVVVLGGGVSNVKSLYTKGVEAAKRSVFNNRLDTKIVQHQLGDSAGVFGAAMLCA